MRNHPRKLALLAALLGLSLPAFARAAVYVAPDPAGDTFALGPDIYPAMTATLEPDPTPTTLSLSVSFADPIAPPSDFAPESVYGYLLLDVDQNPTTGLDPSTYDFLRDHSGGLGIDFYVDLFSEMFNPGMVDLLDADSNLVDTLPITFEPAGSPTSFSMTIPLTSLGDDGTLNFGAVVGTDIEPSDEVFGTTGPDGIIPEPSTFLIWSMLVGLGVGVGWRRRR